MKKFLLLYFFFLFFLLSFFSSGTIESQDGQQYLAVARNIYYEHWPSAPPYEYDKRLNIHMNVLFNPRDGKYYSGTGLGYSVAMLPAVFISDIFHRAYKVSPPTHFPLESDWLVLFVASFTNAFFGALLGITLYSYFRETIADHKQALVTSFLALFATNILAYTKHGFAHVMFTTFLVMTFYFLKRASKVRTTYNLFLAGAAFGIAGLSYNPVFLLALPSLIVYFILLFPLKSETRTEWFKKMFFGFLGGLPFGLLYLFYNYIRLGSGLNSGYGTPVITAPKGSTLVVIFESLWGYFFSSGRSVFLYSPILLIPVIFWNKLKFVRWKAEAISFAILAVVYLLFYSAHRGEDWYGWAGESSWGPRYILLLVPFAMFFVLSAWQRLKKVQKLWIGLPLLLASFYVQFLGVALPYEIKFAGIPYQTFIGDVRLTTWDYGNFLPRFSPLIKQTKTLGKRVLNFTSDHNHGSYDGRLIDGFEGIFAPWPKVYWRPIHGEAVASYRGSGGPLPMEFDFANTQTGSPSGYVAHVKVLSDGEVIGQTTIDPEKWASLVATPSASVKQVGLLSFQTEFAGTSSAQQKVFLRGWRIRGESVPLQTFDEPYAQPLAQKMSGEIYYVWGTDKVDNWDRWYMRSAIYQGTFDFWWIKPLYYRDLPKRFLWLLLGADLLAIALLARKVWRFKVQ